MEYVIEAIKIILLVLTILNAYKFIFYISGFFKKRTYEETDVNNRYAVVISARNEEKTIANLLESINKQDYPKELIDVYVIADNCSEGDKTKEIALSHNAIVFERHDLSKARKGYALEYFFGKLKDENKILDYAGFFIFDADNVLSKTFVKEMNKAFCSGRNKVFIGYRNSKNADSNPISSAHALKWYGMTYLNHRAKNNVGLSTKLTGTGILISSELLKDGYNYHTLTEDVQFSCDLISKGYKIGYCEDAEFFDEQPTNFFVSVRQRIRWERGRLACFFKYFPKLIKGIFVNKKLSSKISCYDQFWEVFPYTAFSMILSLVAPISAMIISIFYTHDFDIISILKLFAVYEAGIYANAFLFSLLYELREYKHLRCPLWKLILFNFVIPWYDLINVYICFAAILFPKGKWHPVDHKIVRNEEDIPKL